MPTLPTAYAQGLLFTGADEDREAAMSGLAVSLGATDVGPLSAPEEQLISNAISPTKNQIRQACAAIACGHDPLGDELCTIRPAEERRGLGATYTPSPVIRSMMHWCADNGRPETVVDPGTGSARFLCAAAHTFPDAALVGVEIDPLAALIARANLAQTGASGRARVILSDYRTAELDAELKNGPALYVGNPPYVRHHNLPPVFKQWLVREGSRLSLPTSALAGLHVYFFLATAMRLRDGDYGCFITSGEWLDVNYGRMVRQLFLSHLGGTRLVVVEPEVEIFPDAATTSVISCFKGGSKPRSVFVQRARGLGQLKRLDGKRRVRRERLETETRWSHLTRRNQPAPSGFIELGELCRVHRGQVTGANDIWIVDPERFGLPRKVLFHTVTRAKELFGAGLDLQSGAGLRVVADLPVELDELRSELPQEGRRELDRFLRYARAQGAADGYIARNRRAWWSVGLREPAPILATYMARRPPAFVQNSAKARHLNVAHGLYPRERLSRRVLGLLVKYLSTAVSQRSGRTYAGGLTKFEPREMERIYIPEPQALEAGSFA